MPNTYSEVAAVNPARPGRRRHGLPWEVSPSVAATLASAATTLSATRGEGGEKSAEAIVVPRSRKEGPNLSLPAGDSSAEHRTLQSASGGVDDPKPGDFAGADGQGSQPFPYRVGDVLSERGMQLDSGSARRLDSPPAPMFSVEAMQTGLCHGGVSPEARSERAKGVDAGGVGQGMVAELQYPQASKAMGNAWFRDIGLVNLKSRHAGLNQWKKPPDTVSTSSGVGGRGP